MADPTAEKTHEPTAHRRQKAREEGRYARSQDLGAAVIVVVGVGTLLVSGAALVEFLVRYGRRQLGGEAWLSLDIPAVAVHCNGVMAEAGRALLPLLGLLVAAALLVHFGQAGFLFLPSKLGLDATRLDPLAALRRIFSSANLARLAFGLLKITAVVGVAAACLNAELPALLGLTGHGVPAIAGYAGGFVLGTGLKVGLALLALAVLDYGYQRWRHEQDLKMTPQEVREELKNLEGDPQVLARRRAVQRQLALNRLADAVPKADAVLIAPGDLAVALRYDAQTMTAPILVAKGAGRVAQRIRQLAQQHAIPIVERQGLAQALFREVELNRPIPAQRFAATAEVLADVYQRQTVAANS